MKQTGLKELIEERFGRKVENKDDLEELVLSIKEKVGEDVNINTLANIFNINLY